MYLEDINIVKAKTASTLIQIFSCEEPFWVHHICEAQKVSCLSLYIEIEIYLLKLKKVQCVLCGFVSGQNIDKLIEFFPIHNNNAILYFEMYIVQVIPCSVLIVIQS